MDKIKELIYMTSVKKNVAVLFARTDSVYQGTRGFLKHG